MSGLHYDSLDDCPEGLRKLLEKRMAKESGVPNINDGNKKHFADTGKMVGLPQEKEPKRKYHNLPTERLTESGECIKFDSKKEAARYDFLMLELASGRIRDLRLQYQILLQPAYTDAVTGERIRAISYLADFRYERQDEAGTWREVIEDTKGGKNGKGTRTAEFNIKKKLLNDKGIRVVIV